MESGPGGVPVLTAIANRAVVERLTLVDDGSDHVYLSTTVLSAQAFEDYTPLRLSRVIDLRPGHGSEERALSPRH